MRAERRWISGMMAVLGVIMGSASCADPPVQSPQSSLQLSLADAIKLAQDRSPLVRQSDAQVAGASAGLKSASTLPNPTLSLAHAYGSKETAGFDEDIVAAQTFELPGKRQPRIKAARLERDAILSERSASMLDLTFAVKSAYYEVLRSDAEYQLAADTLSSVRQFAEAAVVQFEAGQVPRSNVIRSEIEQTRAEQNLTVVETDRTERFATLASLIGAPVGTTLSLTDKLTYTPGTYDLQALESRALDSRPDLRAARLRRDALAASVSAERAQRQPDPFVEFRHSTIDPSQGGSSVRFGIAMPLLDWGGIRSNTAAAKASLAAQQAGLDELIRTARLEVGNAFRTYEQSRRVIESFQGGRVDRARELLDMARTGYEKGATSYLEVLDAQQLYRNEQADYARALADYNLAVAALERAVGGKTE